VLNKEKVTNVLDFPPMHFRQLATSILHFFFSSLPVLITNNNYVCENVNYISEDLFDSHTHLEIKLKPSSRRILETLHISICVSLQKS
jgi:PHD/YefM family antitoxin component YafN of YafNO toxin-antitoxin module